MNVSLIMFRENGEQKQFQIEAGKTVIGRKEDCGLRIPLGEISRKHAILMVDEKAVTLRDLGSANGTYVNNKRVTEQELQAGDHIVIGPLVFTVQIDGHPADLRHSVRPTRSRPVRQFRVLVTRSCHRITKFNRRASTPANGSVFGGFGYGRATTR